MRTNLTRTMLTMLLGLAVSPALGQQPEPAQRQSSYDLPHNFYGAHLLVDDGAPGTRGFQHLQWARHLVGRWGHAKTLFMNITNDTRGPEPGWVDYVNRCYELELIPFLRLAGVHDGSKGYWLKPEADAPGDYTSIARAVRRVVEGLPRTDLCPIYIEIWNEPNLAVEWTGQPNHEEYAAFFVQVARAIRAIGDDRIKILNGGLATSAAWTRKLCEAQPDFVRLFDFWSSHPYPMNRPPSQNHHDGTVPPTTDLTIDSYVLETAVLEEFGRTDVKVMITETGYDLGNGSVAEWPIIDEYNRADYMVRAFRDYWPRWPEIVAVFPFQFCSEGWERFDWVYPHSGTNPDGSPTLPHYQYTAVAALAKPTDPTGAINGTITVADLGARLEGAVVRAGPYRMRSDPMGNYFVPDLRPGQHTITITRPGFEEIRETLRVEQGENTVFDPEMVATRRASLSGEVRSGDDGRALGHVEITLEPGGQRTRTNRFGRYSLDDLIPARYALSAVADGHFAYEVDRVEVDAGRTNRHDFVLGRHDGPDAPNMLKNVSMEAGGGGGGKPGVALGFEPAGPYQDPWAEVTDREAHTGRMSQRLRVVPQEVVIRQITHYSIARPGKTYLAGIWIKTDAPGRDGVAWMTFDFTDNGGGVIERLGPTRKIAGRSDWTWVSLEGVAPPGSQRLSVNLHTQGAGGLAYFDDAYLGMIE